MDGDMLRSPWMGGSIAERPMPNQLTTECGNPTCNCMVEATPEAESYCSESCRRVEETEEMSACSCGHPACDAE
jgi:hypothetical protein